MSDQTILIIVALICITLIEVTALFLGFNGALLTLVIGALAGLVGYEVKARKSA